MDGKFIFISIVTFTLISGHKKCEKICFSWKLGTLDIKAICYELKWGST